MFAVIAPYYLWFKAFHIIAMIAWMAGQFYLPRLFVYHCQTKIGSEESERFKTMERKLQRVIINPAMICTFIFGILLACIPGVVDFHSGWWSIKIISVILLFGFHGACSRWRKQFFKNQNKHSEKFYRYMNEIPTILMIIIVIMVIVKPF
ncbi:protoporphyrinogen oxidase HemJ [Commensalibacter nepenthis]|uniref:Protoporphyrinogen IX oxidase n=1 Tax=Commensalibacter nepenthis TaxID=3043872 RepID=A0ABT6Q761_9PROT|nr:protoporphyrinogen oxidase HemJ [Commensalibacter sp. TBRC 10068]MDI2112734.1 protoporphyrinogen oxidase HemJ [Commensalibacter sp. TBRC 10068]